LLLVVCVFLEKRGMSASDPSAARDSLHVGVTGARPSNLLLYAGRIKFWRGMVVEVLEGTIPPGTHHVEFAFENSAGSHAQFSELLRKKDPFFAALAGDPLEFLRENMEAVEGRGADNMVLRTKNQLRLRIWELGGTAREQGVPVSPLLKLGDDVLHRAMSPEGILAGELETELRVTMGIAQPPLLFFPHYWQIKGEMELGEAVPKGELWIDMDVGTLSREAVDVPKDRGVIRLELSRNEVVFVVVNRENQWRRPNITEDTLEVAFDVMAGVGQKDFHDVFVGNLTAGFTAGAYKSLVQKLLRYGPLNVGVPEHAHTLDASDASESFDGGTMLVFACVALYTNRGSFNPDLGKFVRGTESFLKRVVVSAVEDCFVKSSHSRLALRTLVAARIVSQFGTDWRPSRAMMTEIFNWVLDMQQDAKFHAMDLDPRCRSASQFFKVANVRHDEGYATDFALMSVLLDDIKSLHGDLLMFRNVARRAQNEKVHGSMLGDHGGEINDRPVFMPVYHCIDQHWYPSILYAFDGQEIESFRSSRGQTHYGTFFGQLFSDVSGLNWRKKKINLESLSPFQLRVKLAQELAYVARRDPPVHRWCEEVPITAVESQPASATPGLAHTFHDAWLAGAVGQLKIQHDKRHFVATVNPENVQEIQVIVDPSRGPGKVPKKQFGASGMGSKDENVVKATEKVINENYSIDPSVLDSVRDKVWATLREMKRSPVIRLPSATLCDAQIEVADDKTFKMGDVPWENARSCFEPLGPLVEAPERSDADGRDSRLERFVMGIYPELAGHVDGAKDLLVELAQRTQAAVLRRVLQYIDQFQEVRAVIAMPKISRSGAGAEAPLDRDDVQAFHCLVELASLYPNALQRRRGTICEFVVQNPIALWDVRSQLLNVLADEMEEFSAVAVAQGWNQAIRFGNHAFPHKVIQLHQQDALDRMERRRLANFSGNFLWIPTGGGKTAIVLQHLKNRIVSCSMPRFAVYVLPQSALRSVATEIWRFGFLNVAVLWTNTGQPAPGTHEYSIGGEGPSMAGLPVVRDFSNLQPYTLFLVNQDFHTSTNGQSLLDALVARGSETYLVYDEVHRAMSSDTDRTKTAHTLIRAAADFTLLSATPVTAGDTRAMMAYVSQMVPFPVVHGKNDMVAINTMIRKVFDIGIDIRVVEKNVALPPESKQRYEKIMPPGLGGTNARVSFEDFREAADIAYRAVDEGIVAAIRDQLQYGGVFVVARDMGHRTSLVARIETEFPSNRVLLVGPDPLNIEVCDVTSPPPIVVGYVSFCEGFNLQGLKSMVTSAYPRNPATLLQLDGRLPRLGQQGIPGTPRPYVLKTVVLAGLLVQLNQKKQRAKNLDEALKQLAQSTDDT
jgi:hypothetical protein